MTSSAPAILLANFDCERQWAKAAPLPNRIVRRLEPWTPLLAAIAPSATPVRLVTMREWSSMQAADAAACQTANAGFVAWGAVAPALTPPPDALATALVATSLATPSLRAMPSDANARWALLTRHRPNVAAALAASNRRAISKLSATFPMPFATCYAVDSMADVLEILQTNDHAWVLKPSLTAAGRERVVLRRDADTQALAVARGLLRDRQHCILEPWVARTRDLGQAGLVTPTELYAFPPHELAVASDGAFTGVRVRAEDDLRARWPAAWLEALGAALRTAAAWLRALGYEGPFGIDAFAYRTEQGEAFRPLCEINARLTFGWLAQSWARRLGTNGELTFRAPAADTAVKLASAAWFVQA